MIRYNERISINNKEITNEEISAILGKIAEKIQLYNQTHEAKVKEFDILTIIALIYFAQNNCDFVVLETGMGGIYDSTNIVNGMISIITDIGLDHMDILGKTVEEIAEKKAGIIKENQDTIMYSQEKVNKIIEETCKEKNNTLHLLEKENIKNYAITQGYSKFDYKNYKDIYVNLKGKCQIYNAMLAIESMEILKKNGFSITEEAIKIGLKTVIHKARFEEINSNPKVIFDGGHNENAIKNLKNTINEHYQKDKKTYIISILKTKDYRKAIELLTEDKEAKFIFTSGNDSVKYVAKEELYEEGAKYLDKNIYKKELKEAIEDIQSEEITFVIRKLLCIRRCNWLFRREKLKVMINIKNLSYKYKNGKTVLENINLKVQDGEVVSIIRKKWVRKINFSKTYCRNNCTNFRRYFSR